MPVSRLRTSLRAFAAVLRNPDLRRMAIAYLGFSVLEYGTWVALLVYAYDASGPASVGLVAFGQLVPAAFFAPLINSYGDRYRRDRLLVAGYARTRPDHARRRRGDAAGPARRRSSTSSPSPTRAA